MADNAPTDVIIASGVIIVGSTMMRNAIQKKSHFSPIVFGFMLVSALMFLAVPMPNFAKGLAYMGMVGAFAVNGPPIFKLIGGLGK